MIWAWVPYAIGVFTIAGWITAHVTHFQNLLLGTLFIVIGALMEIRDALERGR